MKLLNLSLSITFFALMYGFFSCTPSDKPNKSPDFTIPGQVVIQDDLKQTLPGLVDIPCYSDIIVPNGTECDTIRVEVPCPCKDCPVFHFVTGGGMNFAGNMKRALVVSDNSTGCITPYNDKAYLNGDFFIQVPCERVPDLGNSPPKPPYSPPMVGSASIEVKVFRNGDKILDSKNFYLAQTDGSLNDMGNSLVLNPTDYHYICLVDTALCVATVNLYIEFDMPLAPVSPNGLDKYNLTFEVLTNDVLVHEDVNSKDRHNFDSSTPGGTPVGLNPVELARWNINCEQFGTDKYLRYRCIEFRERHDADHLLTVDLPSPCGQTYNPPNNPNVGNQN